MFLLANKAFSNRLSFSSSLLRKPSRLKRLKPRLPRKRVMTLCLVCSTKRSSCDAKAGNDNVNSSEESTPCNVDKKDFSIENLYTTIM